MKYPLLLRACMNNKFGTIHAYPGGHIYEAGFIFLDGEISMQFFDEIKNRWKDRMFICLSDVWERELLTSFPDMVCTQRYQMVYSSDERVLYNLETYKDAISPEYKCKRFEENAYMMSPFHHGSNYNSYENFKLNGSGFVVWDKEKIVSSASSFLSYENEVELDVSTLVDYRNKGLGIACCAEMLLDCMSRNIRVHWDAQNIASLHMAKKLGYSLECTYKAFSFVKPEQF